MSRTPTWAKDKPVADAVTLDLERASEQMQADVAAEKLHTRVTGTLPSNRESARRPYSVARWPGGFG